MKLSLKLPLAFAATLLLVLGAALYGIYSLNQSLAVYATQVKASTDNERAVSDLALAFKTQVQEWKNTLLRGKDPKALDKHWSAFNKIERDMAEKAKKLVAALPEGEGKALVEKFAAAHLAMGQRYHKGFESFKAAGFDAEAGDAAVKGMDREPTKLLDEAVDKIAAAGAAVATQAAADGQRATVVSLVLMLVSCGAGLAGGVLFSRSITRPIGRAAAVARRIAAGDLTSSVPTGARDEMGQLLDAMRDMQTSLVKVVEAVDVLVVIADGHDAELDVRIIEAPAGKRTDEAVLLLVDVLVLIDEDVLVGAATLLALLAPPKRRVPTM